MGRKRPADPETQHFKYLNRLRAGGRTNMYGAVPYLMRTFGLERGPAFDVICRWIDAFEARRAEAPSTGNGEIAGPLPARPVRSAAAVVVHRPRRPSRAKPPRNRKPVPEVRIAIARTKPGNPRSKTRKTEPPANAKAGSRRARKR
jgi:hypothetical protein